MKDLIKDTPRPSLIKRNIPPLYKDLLIWTNRVYDPTTHQIKSRISPQYNLTLKQRLCAGMTTLSEIAFDDLSGVTITDYGTDTATIAISGNKITCSVAGNIYYIELSNGAYLIPVATKFYDVSGNAFAPIGDSLIDFTARSDDALFWCDEKGFAVKSGTIYPKLLDGSGYAGLVGDPDVTYQGLIALQGQIEIGAQNYLKTLLDFAQTPNTVIEDAGLILDDYTALDCNDDLIYTADPYLDPLTYPNAFTAMTLANVSQQRYSDLTDNNASRRIFIKYRRGTDVTDDGSRALITAGTIAEILVYKRDLSVAEAIRVLKYCADMPMDNQTMVGDVPSVDADDNFVFSCIGHTEPEIEIEEP